MRIRLLVRPNGLRPRTTGAHLTQTGDGVSKRLADVLQNCNTRFVVGAGFLWEPDSSGDGFGWLPVGARFIGRWVWLRSLSRNKLRSHKTSSHGCNCGSPIHRAMGLAATLSRNKLRSHKISSTKSAPQNQFPPNQFPQNQFPPNQLPHHSSLRRPDPHTEISQPLRVPIWVVANFVA